MLVCPAVNVCVPDFLIDPTLAAAIATFVVIIDEFINGYRIAASLTYIAYPACHFVAIPIAYWTDGFTVRQGFTITLPLAILTSPAAMLRNYGSFPITMSTGLPLRLSFCFVGHDIVP